ncbi:MAG: binding-protein-dependent transport system inner rane component [Paenibacillaceae bacterium]|jgi:multiple sugar transport system permease protein|nr:binding-protein-dependent transport system inner rane component [Paenibacillaceae bacterium]
MQLGMKKSHLVIIYAALTLVLIGIAFPIVYAVGGSFKTTEDFLLGGTRIFPEVFQFDNYVKAWNQANFARYTFNSIFFAGMSVIGTVITASMAGYTLSRSNFPGKKFILSTFGFMLFMLGAVTLFPIFLICKELGLLNSLWGMVIAQVASAQPFFCILIMGYCEGITKEIDECARIDGASFFKIYTSIIMPIITPILATAGILAFRDAWNNYMMPLAFTLSRPDLRTLTVGVVLLKDQGEGVAAWNIMMAGTVMSILPILIVYLFLNRYFIEGLTSGAVKG